jgi:hypothetical protein
MVTKNKCEHCHKKKAIAIYQRLNVCNNCYKKLVFNAKSLIRREKDRIDRERLWKQKHLN